MLAIVGLLSAGVLVTSGIAWYRYRVFNKNIVRINAVAGPRPKTDIDGKDQNILIVGNDNRNTASDQELAEIGASRDGGSLNTDTMMIVHVPADGSKVTLISLPRDSYVEIPGYGKHKLNSAYPDGYEATKGDETAKEAGGAQLLVQTLQNLTGLTIDHFVQVDLLGFYRISNAIGGVPVVLCQAQKEPNSGINLPAGPSLIQGKQALAFVRQRYGLTNGDLDRIVRQQYFLHQAFDKIASAGVLLNPGKLNSLLTAVTQSLQMDPGLNPLQLAQQLQNLTANNLITKTIPTQGFDDNTPDGSVVVVDPAQVQQFVHDVFNPPAATPAAPAVDPATVTVNVVNSSGANGAGTTAGKALTALGFKAGTVETGSDTVQATVVEYPNGQQAQAQAVAAHIPGAQLKQSASVTAVTVVLGTDGKKVGAPAPTPSTPAAAPTPANQPAGCVN